VLYYAFLRTPGLLEQAAPLAVLAGCLFAFGQLARENTVVALRSTGISAYQLVGIIAPVGVAVLLLNLAALQWVSPRADQALDIWWSRSAPKTTTAAKPQGQSFRVGDDVVAVGAADPSGRSLQDVSIYRRDPSGRLVERLHAQSAVYLGGGWRLLNPRFDSLAGPQVESGQAAEMVWRPGPRPQDVRGVFQGDAEVAPGAARSALSGGASARPPAFYATTLQRSWAAPFGALVMLLLAAPVLLINFRGGGARTLVSCLGAGMLFLVIDGLFTAMGQSGTIPAVLGAWAAPALFAAAGASALLFLEG
jgi:lipopolysaccharide export system permease protein